LLGRDIRERETQQEKQRGENRRGARKEIRRAGGAEQAAGGAAAEAGAHVRALAVLEQHQADDRQRRDDVRHDEYVGPHAAHGSPAFTYSLLPLFAESLWPPAMRRRSSRRRRRASQKSPPHSAA